MINICFSCGKDDQNELCETCLGWGITQEELFPTFCDALTEQFHRLGKDGKRYWGRLGAAILFTDGSNVLLLKRSENSDHANTWCLPGGRAKENEVPLDTARREAKEESGSVEGSRFQHFHDKDGSHHFHTYLYAVSKPFDVKLSKEHTDSAWTPLNEVEKLKLHPKFKEAWPTYLRAIKKRFPEKSSFEEWLLSRD